MRGLNIDRTKFTEVTKEKAQEQLGAKEVSIYYDEVDECSYWFNSETGEIYIPNKRSALEIAKEKHFNLNK